MIHLTVISHSCVLPENQRLWAEVARQPGIDLTLIAPRRWNSTHLGPLQFVALPELEGHARPLRVYWPGHPHLHTYSDLGPEMTAHLPDVLYLDEDPGSLVASQVLSLRSLMEFRLVIALQRDLRKTNLSPFAFIEHMACRQASAAVVACQGCLREARGKGFKGPAAVVPHQALGDLTERQQGAALQADVREIVGLIKQVAKA